MSDERKLRLVPPPTEGASQAEGAGRSASVTQAADDEAFAPPSAEELAEADALREALDRLVDEAPDGEDPLAGALRAAWSPKAMADVDHEALLARALGDLDAPATEVEGRAAAQLASELAGQVAGEGSAAHQLARAARNAHAPKPLDAFTHERILKRTLVASSAPAATTAKAPSKRGRLGAGLAAATTVVAAAAAFALFVRFGAAPAASMADRRSESAAAPAAAAASAAAPAASAAPAPSATAAPPPPPAAAVEAPAPFAQAKTKRAAPAGRSAAPDKQPARDAKADARVAGAEKRRERAESAAAPSAAAAPPPQLAPRPRDAEVETAVAAYVPVRSTDDLFGAQPFPKTGGESARIDRIAMARASDLRQNRFAAWGVR